MAGIVADVMVALLAERARDGQVPLREVERIADLVRRGTISLDNAFLAHEEGCRQVHNRPRGNVGARGNPFRRLMVRPFESLLSGDPPPFPRKFLSNYFAVAEHFLGEKALVFDRRCKAIIQALLVVHGNNLTWDHFYQDPRTGEILSAALGVLNQALSTPQGLAAWNQLMQRPAEDGEVADSARIAEVLDALVATAEGLGGR